jgi:hypothetical protein
MFMRGGPSENVAVRPVGFSPYSGGPSASSPSTAADSSRS